MLVRSVKGKITRLSIAPSGPVGFCFTAFTKNKKRKGARDFMDGGIEPKSGKKTGHGKSYNQRGAEFIVQLWKEDNSMLFHLTVGTEEPNRSQACHSDSDSEGRPCTLTQTANLEYLINLSCITEDCERKQEQLQEEFKKKNEKENMAQAKCAHFTQEGFSKCSNLLVAKFSPCMS